MNISIKHINEQRAAIEVLTDPENQALIIEEARAMIGDYDADGSIGSGYEIGAEVSEYGDIMVEVITKGIEDQYYNIVRNESSNVNIKHICCTLSRILYSGDVNIYINCFMSCDLPSDDYAILMMLGKVHTTTADPVTTQSIYCEIPDSSVPF